MKELEELQPMINDIERRLGIMQSVEPVLEKALESIDDIRDVEGMGKR